MPTTTPERPTLLSNVDFFCPAAYLVVEVDGRHHEHRRGKDRQRDRYLWASHHRVMRVEPPAVLESVDDVVERIRRAVDVDNGTPKIRWHGGVKPGLNRTERNEPKLEDPRRRTTTA